MTQNNSSDFSYEYLCAVSQAIEAYTLGKEANNAQAYAYRGVNLKRAIERGLFFTIINNIRLFNFYHQWKQNRLPAQVELNDASELSFALLLCGNALPKERFVVKTRMAQRLKHMLMPLCSLTKNNYRALCWQFIRLFDKGYNRPQVLIHCVHEKFIRFLRPVTSSLKVSFAYLIVKNTHVRNGLIEYQMPFIDFSNKHIEGTLGQMSDELRELGGFVYHFDHIYESLKAIKPGCVIITEGNAPENEMINQASKLLSIPVVCIQQGWAPVVHIGFRYMTYAKFLAWGDGFVKLLQPYNPDQKFISVGSYVVEQKPGCELSARLNGKKGVCFFLQLPSTIIIKEGWDIFLKLIQWTAQSYPQLPVMVREHPNHSMTKEEREALIRFDNVSMVPGKEFPLSTVLHSCDFTVSIRSSTILESIACGVFPVIYNMLSPCHSPDVAGAHAGIEVKDFQTAKKVISALVNDKDFVRQYKAPMAEFRKEYFNIENGEYKALERVVREIESCVEGYGTDQKIR